MSLSVHIDNKNKNILIVGRVSTQASNDTTLTAEAKYPINYKQSWKKIVLSLSNSFLFANATKLYQFKAQDSDVKDYALSLGNISKDLSINDIKKNTKLKGNVIFFSVDFNSFDTNDILDIHKDLMKRI